MKRIIATDEAGYGPQLGPLVIASTCWDCDPALPSDVAFDQLVGRLRSSTLTHVELADSKKLFGQRKAGGLASLESAMISVAACLSETMIDRLDLWLDLISPSAGDRLRDLKWYAALKVPFPEAVPAVTDWQSFASDIRAIWKTESLALTGAVTEVVPASLFNLWCQDAGNKATLLTETTLRLVAPQIEASDARQIDVYCDKHGGRAFYGGVLQHFFPDAELSIVEEGRLQSRYRLQRNDQSITWNFTAKGDAFPPVALASMIAKYTRERLMGVFNAYWGAKVEGLAPTAGYPGDAQRFLRDIADAIARDQIDHSTLVRSR
ncbi:MAG: hypothetical protein R3C05_13195 [Pirellulaceae bacterium]